MQAEPRGPVVVDFVGPLEIARWRPLLHWLMAIPQLLINQALGMLRGVLTLIAFFTVLFTKQIPRPLFDVIVMTLRYQWRVMSYLMFMRESYPPFDFTPTTEDDGSDPAILSIEYPTELSRFMPLIKWFLAIPHFIALAFMLIGFLFASIIAFFTVLFTGRYPAGIRNYGVGLTRWSTRVLAYVGLLRDEYPPFSMS